MSYSITLSGNQKELEEQAAAVPAPPDDQIEAATAALLVFSQLEPFWEILFNEPLNDESKFTLHLSGHAETPGTAKGFFNMRIDIL